MAVSGITGANYLLSRIGNPYSYEDCVHAVVINLIRNCEGGDKSYRTAGCTELWNSIEKTGKYRHITKRMTLTEAKQEGLLIGDLPVIYDAGTGKCEHIAYYMGGIGGYECIHSSASKGCVCGTTLKNGFTHVLRHRDIIGVNANGVAEDDQNDQNEQSEEKTMNVLYYATVATQGGALNMRSGAKKANNIICEIPFGTKVAVIEAPSGGWTKVMHGNSVGYVSSDYLAYAGNAESEAPKVDQTDDEPALELNTAGGSWGVFVPCANKIAANLVAPYFEDGKVIKVKMDD